MNIDLNKRAEDVYANLPIKIREAFKKQVSFLEKDLRYPSLHAKKYHEETGVWQARVNKDWRFYFIIQNNTIIIINIKKHPK